MCLTFIEKYRYRPPEPQISSNVVVHPSVRRLPFASLPSLPTFKTLQQIASQNPQRALSTSDSMIQFLQILQVLHVGSTHHQNP